MTDPVTLFVSDLHLDDARPQVTALFERFLIERTPTADALYILGDLFEAWIGDDDRSPLTERVCTALADAARRLPVRVMHGNRDFLMGEGFEQRSGATLLADPMVIDLHGTATLVSHGDAWCTDDALYQAFRGKVRDPAWQRAFLAQPLEARRAFAAEARAESARQNASKATYLMDVNDAAIRSAFRAHDVRRIIHGHTHRPAIHPLEVDGAGCERIVLGDWYEQGSVLTVDRHGAKLESLAP